MKVFQVHILFFILCIALISCKDYDVKAKESFCKIENLNQHYNGISFNLNMSLNQECYDVDATSFGMRKLFPFWIESIGDTLLLKKHPFWGIMVSDSCEKDDDCQEQTLISYARMKRTNLQNSNYKWFIAWVDSSTIREGSLFPKGTRTEIFNSMSHQCLKIIIPCFKKNDSRNRIYDFSTDDLGVVCSYCGE